MSGDSGLIASLGKTSFACPHCGAHAQQQWGKVFVSWKRIDDPPRALNQEIVDQILKKVAPGEEREDLRRWCEKWLSGKPLLKSEDVSEYCRTSAENVHFSQCFSCRDVSIWIGNTTVFPDVEFDIVANPDLPDQIRADFDEARSIIRHSPRGAAALLRLAIQRLCNHLGKTGDINTMIAELVADGLNVRVKQALDIVRVIGNESVHPGQIDVRDTPEMAERLFTLVNLICEKMISEPKHIEEMYAKLPPEKVAAIETRDKKALSPPKSGA